MSRSRPFRSLGLYRSSGKHAAPKGFVPEPRPVAEPGQAHRPAHAATMPRLTSPNSEASDTNPADTNPADTNPTDASAASADQHAA